MCSLDSISLSISEYQKHYLHKVNSFFSILKLTEFLVFKSRLLHSNVVEAENEFLNESLILYYINWRDIVLHYYVYE